MTRASQADSMNESAKGEFVPVPSRIEYILISLHQIIVKLLFMYLKETAMK